MAKIDRGVSAFSKSNTQTTAKLMTLTMLSPGSPYHTLKQILAQIERKRQALSEAYFKYQKDEIKLQEKQKENTPLAKIEYAEIQAQRNNSVATVEATIKEIGMYQHVYDEVCKNHNIPDNWDESDVEKAEIKHHISSAFRNAIRDSLAHGRFGMGTLEYIEQFGISPQEAIEDINEYLSSGKKDYDDMMVFLDTMAYKYSENYKKVMARIGIDTLIDNNWLYEDNK